MSDWKRLGDRPVHAEPLEVSCPKCEARPGHACRAFGEALSWYHHVRRTVPILYVCRVCSGPCYLSSASGNLVHRDPKDWEGKLHSATPFDDQRRWTP